MKHEVKYLHYRRASFNGEPGDGYDVIDKRHGRIEADCLSREEAEQYIQDYYASLDKVMLFKPLSDELSHQECRNIVESNLKAIRARKKRKLSKGFSLWNWLMGDGRIRTGGAFDLKRDKI